MATYIVGDLQGCYGAFMGLLQELNFNPSQDSLWCAGDLINRGENSLATLRHIYEHRHAMQAVLGNHDFHLLSTFFQKRPPRPKDTFSDILSAPDSAQLMHWLRNQPICHHFAAENLFLSHAGLYPGWSLETALQLGKEVNAQLQGEEHGFLQLFGSLYGNEPQLWSPQLTGPDRLRFIVNAFTRMRFLDSELKLNMEYKSSINEAPSTLSPWFNHGTTLSGECHIAFGHWAALEGDIPAHTNGKKLIHALDTGCVWGGPLTALELGSNRRIST